MLISPDDIADVKRRHELPTFIASSGVELSRKGKFLVGLCPFHDDHRPSLVVDPQTALWNCLGACRANGNAGGGKGSSGGDVIAYAMKLWGVDFREALKRLGASVRDELPPPRPRNGSNGTSTSSTTPMSPATPTPPTLSSSPSRPSRPPRPPRPYLLVAESRAPATDLFLKVVDIDHQELSQNVTAQEYLESRGLVTRELWRAFHLGYASGAIEDLSGTEASEARRILVERGILTAEGKERMKGRIVVPLYAFNQLPVGLYGRSVDEAHEPHHLFLPGPRRGLLNQNAGKRGKEILFVESPLDALSLAEAGVLNAVPLFGISGLTEDHRELVRRFGITSVVLGLDSDEPGKKATPHIAAAFEELGVAVKLIEWPEKDPNACLMAYGSRRLKEIVEKLLAAPRVCGVALPPVPVSVEPVTVSGAVTPPPLIALAHPDVVPIAVAVRKEKAEPDTEDLRAETLTRVFDERLWRLTWLDAPTASSIKVTAHVTLGSSEGAPSFLDTLNLVTAKARESFAKRAAAAAKDKETDRDAFTRLLHAVEGDLVKLAELGERRRALLEETSTASRAVTGERKTKALAFLRSADLLSHTAEHIEAVGYVGERTNKLIGYLVAISRKLDAALSAVILSPSGSGKSALADALEILTPPEDLLTFTRITTQALYWMKRDTLLRKFVVIEERFGSMEADYSIRALQSKKKLTLAVPMKDPSTGQIETKIFEILGPAAFLESTTESQINHENATRCFEIHLDESVEQTRRIHEAQRRAKTAAGQRERLTAEETAALHHDAQRLLRTVKVTIPFAQAIEFPSTWVRTRRDNFRFLNLVEVLAFLRQYQRPLREFKTDELVTTPLEEIPDEKLPLVRVEASLDDYAAAYELAGDLLQETFRELKKPARDLDALVKRYVRQEAEARDLSPLEVVFTRREIREQTGLPNHRVKQLFRELEELEYIAVTRGTRGAASAYRLVDLPETGERKAIRGLLTAEELRRKLS